MPTNDWWGPASYWTETSTQLLGRGEEIEDIEEVKAGVADLKQKVQGVEQNRVK